MLVNCFLLWLVHSQGVQLSPLGFAACQSKNCTNKTVGYCLVGALQGGAAVSAAPTKLLATAWLVHCKGVQLSQLHQQNCWLLLGWCT